MTAEKKTIFIHIPKTGGTSINCEIMGTDWQTTPDFFYRHIIYQTKKSNSGDIFERINIKKYKEFNVFMMVREPIERLFSEYYFLKDRPEFFSLLSNKPSNFYEYCLLANNHNSMIKFLVGQKIYSNKKIGNRDWEEFLYVLKSIPVRIGVFERYEESLSYLAECFGMEWSATIEKKRITIYKPLAVELSEEQRKEIEQLNKYDYALYELACDELNESEFDELDIQIVGSKYDYVLKYTERFILFESSFNDKRFLECNALFFKELNKCLHENVKDGKEYVKKWNTCLYNSFLEATQNIVHFSMASNRIDFKEEPIEVTHKLAKLIIDSLVLNPTARLGLQFQQEMFKNNY